MYNRKFDEITNEFKDVTRIVSGETGASRHFYSRCETNLRGINELRKRQLPSTKLKIPSVSLRSNFSFINFISQYGIENFMEKFHDYVAVTTHTKFPELIHFTTKNWINFENVGEFVELMDECRGVTINIENLSIINCHHRKPSKIIDYRDENSVTNYKKILFDWISRNDTRYYEDYDGIYVSLYHYGDAWHISTECKFDSLKHGFVDKFFRRV